MREVIFSVNVYLKGSNGPLRYQARVLPDHARSLLGDTNQPPAAGLRRAENATEYSCARRASCVRGFVERRPSMCISTRKFDWRRADFDRCQYSNSILARRSILPVDARVGSEFIPRN